jgi:hypothetical protein
MWFDYQSVPDPDEVTISFDEESFERSGFGWDVSMDTHGAAFMCLSDAIQHAVALLDVPRRKVQITVRRVS